MNLNMNMNSLESVLAQIQGLSSTEPDLFQLHEVLKKSDELFRAESTRFASFLTELDPATHSLGYLYIMDAYLSGPISKEAANDISLSTARFINVCATDQIRMAPEKFISLCRKFKEQVLSMNAPMRGVGPMLAALRKIQLSSEQLTTLHPDFLQLCLLAKCYKTGLCVLEDDIYDVDQPRDLYLYCYYGGMICIGQKRFQKALDLLRNVITAPMSTMSAIVVEAYKKYILVSLIHLGQFPTSFPKYTSSVAQRNLKNFSQPYLELATSYSTGKISELQTCIESIKDKFESDNNFGLVNQVVSSMYKRNIQRLTQTYLTLSLQDIASTVQLSTPREAEMHVLQMIQNGEIFAKINQKDGMVSFLEDPEQYKSCEMIEHVDSSIERIMNLSRKLTAMDEFMSSDSLYLAKVGRERQRFDFDDFDSVPSKYNL